MIRGGGDVAVAQLVGSGAGGVILLVGIADGDGPLRELKCLSRQPLPWDTGNRRVEGGGLCFRGSEVGFYRAPQIFFTGQTLLRFLFGSLFLPKTINWRLFCGSV